MAESRTGMSLKNFYAAVKAIVGHDVSIRVAKSIDDDNKLISKDQFMINVDGSFSNPIVVRGLDKDLDKEALRIIRNIPDWKPARKDGEPVPMSYICPVVFTIKD